MGLMGLNELKLIGPVVRNTHGFSSGSYSYLSGHAVSRRSDQLATKSRYDLRHFRGHWAKALVLPSGYHYDIVCILYSAILRGVGILEMT